MELALEYGKISDLIVNKGEKEKREGFMQKSRIQEIYDKRMEAGRKREKQLVDKELDEFREQRVKEVRKRLELGLEELMRKLEEELG